MLSWLPWGSAKFEDKSKKRPGSLPKSVAQLATPETLNEDATGGNSPAAGERSIASVIAAEQLAGQGQEGPELVIKNEAVVEPILDQGKQQYPLYKGERRLSSDPMPISEETVAVGQPVNFFQKVPPIDNNYNALLRKTPITDAVVSEGIGATDPTEKRVSQLDNKVTTYEERNPATELMPSDDEGLNTAGNIPTSVSSKSLERAVMFAPPSKGTKPKTGSLSGVENSIAELHVEGVTEVIVPMSMEETQSMTYSRSASFSSEHSKVLSLPPTSNRSLFDGTESETNRVSKDHDGPLKASSHKILSNDLTDENDINLPANRATQDGEGPLETRAHKKLSNADSVDGKDLNSPVTSGTTQDGERPLETRSHKKLSNDSTDGTENDTNSPTANRTTDDDGPLDTSSQTNLSNGLSANLADPTDSSSNQLTHNDPLNSGEMDVHLSSQHGDQQEPVIGNSMRDTKLSHKNARAENSNNVNSNVESFVAVAVDEKSAELAFSDSEDPAEEALIAPTQSMNVSSAIDVPVDTKLSEFYAPIQMERELTPDSLIMDISPTDPAMCARSTSLERSEMRFQIGVDKRVSSASDSGSPSPNRSCDSPLMKTDVFSTEGGAQSSCSSVERSEYYAPPRIQRQLTPDLSVHSSSVTHRSNSSSLERSEMYFQINSAKEPSPSAIGVLKATLDGQTADALDNAQLNIDMAKSSTTTSATSAEISSMQQQTLVQLNESTIVISTAQEFYSEGPTSLSTDKASDGESRGLAGISFQVAIPPDETRVSGLAKGNPTSARAKPGSLREESGADPEKTGTNTDPTKTEVDSGFLIERTSVDPQMAEIKVNLSTEKSCDGHRPDFPDTEEQTSDVSDKNALSDSKPIISESRLDSHDSGADNSNFEGSVASSPAAVDETCSLSSDSVESSRRQMTETEEVIETSVEETVTMVITGVVANPGEDEEKILSMQVAVSLGLLDLQNGSYHNQVTGEKMSMIDAMNSGFIKMGPKKVEKSQEKVKSVGIVTIKTLRETTPYTVKAAMDTRNGQMYHVFQATRRKILNSAKGTFTDLKTGSKMLIGDAVDLGLVEVEYDATSADMVQEEITKTYSVHAIVDQKAKTKVAFHEGVSRGLIDADTGEYIHNTEGTRIPIEEAISKGFIKATIAESAQDVSVDKMGSSVAERGKDAIRKKVMNPINVLHQMKH